jgi:Spy/CpxP family protein refolding chaperone
MNAKHGAVVVTLALLAAAVAAQAAEPKTASKAKSPQVITKPAPGDDDAGMADDDDENGAGGERKVIVREFRGGPGAEGFRWRMRGDGPAGRMGPGMGEGMGRGHGPDLLRLADRLGLDEVQRTKLKAIRERQVRRDIQARADLEIARLDLRQAMEADSPNAATINAQIDKLARMRADQAKARVAAHLEGRSVLTADQLQKLKELRSHGPDMGGGPERPRMGMGPMGRGVRGLGPGHPRVRVQVTPNDPGDSD